MNEQQNTESFSEMWISQLLSLEPNKSSLDQFMMSLLEINRSLCDLSTETLEESFLRVFIFGMKEKEGVFNPTNELIYRVKYLTLIHPSPYSQFLLARIIHFRALYMANKNQNQEIDFDKFRKSNENVEQKKKYFQYSHQIDKTFENEIKLHKKDSLYLQEIQNFSNELKLKLNCLKAHENNFFASLYLILKFGEFLKEKFPNTSLEKIKEELNVYSSDFEYEPLPETVSLYLAEYACHLLSYGEHESGLVVLNDLRTGYEGFLSLLKASTSQPLIHPDENTVKSVLKFIETDLISNSSSRKELDAAVNELSTQLNLQKIDANTISIVLRRFTKVTDNYFINPIKSPKLKYQLKESIDKLINDATNLFGSNSGSSWQIVVGSFKLALLSIFWINPLLNLSLTKKSVDEFFADLYRQSLLVRTDYEEVSESPFSYLFLKDLKKYGDIFNPSDALLYRVKYLTMINQSPYAELLCSEVIRCRTLFMINQNFDIKLGQNKIFSGKDNALQEKYVQIFNLTNATIEKEIRLSVTDSAYLDHVNNISDECNNYINKLEDNQNLFDAFSIFMDFGVLLKEKYKGKSERKIQDELKAHAFDYLDRKKPNLIPFALAKRSKLTLAYNAFELEIENAGEAEFYAGLKGIITLLDLDESEIDATEIHESPSSLITRADTFIVGDLIPNTIPKRELFRCIALIETYALEFNCEAKKAEAMQYVNSMTEISSEYFLYPIKNDALIQKFKKEFDDLILKMSSLTNEDVMINSQLTILIKQITHAVVKVMDVGMNAITRISILNNRKNYSTFFANSSQYSEKTDCLSLEITNIKCRIS